MTSAAPGPTARAEPLRPAGITVLYDAACPVCRRARRWVERHHQLVPVRFVPAGSDLAVRRFPALDVGSTLADVTVVTDEGAVLRGEHAWITVLWAVSRTRSVAFDVAAGRRARLFRRFKSATETVRSLASSAPDPKRTTWPPPGHRDTCVNCGT